MRSKEELVEEYKICRVRGHAPGGMVTASPNPWRSCLHCGTYYRFTQPHLEELDHTIPREPILMSGKT